MSELSSKKKKKTLYQKLCLDMHQQIRDDADPNLVSFLVDPEGWGW